MRKRPQQIGRSMGRFLEWYGKVQLTVDGATPGLVDLGSVRNQTEQAMKSEPVSSTSPWPLYWSSHPGSCLLEFLS